MKWSLDIHKYPSETTRKILQILRDRNITRSSSVDKIDDAETFMDQQGLYSGSKGASGRIKRALFTYFSAYSCMDKNGDLTKFGKLFADGSISVKEFAFHYIANYRVGGNGIMAYYPLEMLLKFSKMVSDIDPDKSFITPTDFKMMQSLDSFGEMDSNFINTVINGNRNEVQGSEIRRWNFDAWKNLLGSAGLFSSYGDNIKLSAPTFIVEWLLYAYSQNPQLEKGNINTGVFSVLPFEGLDNIVGRSLLERSNLRDGHSPWRPFDLQPRSGSATTNIQQNINLDNVTIVMKNFISALKTKPFLLLAGISGTGKSQKVKELAYMTCPDSNHLQDDKNTPGNYCLIEVKPNWHDSTELLGYFSNLTQKYNITPFLHFAYKAIQNPTVPFFVCLDEMNLAPVEQYFAEYLSVLETRSVQGDKIVSAELLSKKQFEGYPEVKEYTESELEVLRYLKENGLRLPENLFVVGTVNMDDTTHQFSRKVIDRAFTIEMNGDELSEMFKEENEKSLEYSANPLPLEALKPKYVRASDALKDEKIAPYKNDITTKVPAVLGAINAILKNTPFRVSYRVQNELVLYLSTLILNNGDVKDIKSLIDTATLVILLEKILPRVQGDEKLLNTDKGNVFKSLKELISTDRAEDDKTDLYTEVCAKLDEIDNRLNNTYFANFF